FIPVGAKDQCLTECQKSAYQYQIDCVNSNPCDKIKSACGDPTGGQSGGGTGDDGGTGGIDAGCDDSFKITVCQQACDSLNFFACLDAATHQECRDLCTTAAANKRDAFTSCANGAGSDCTRGTDCYTQFKQ